MMRFLEKQKKLAELSSSKVSLSPKDDLILRTVSINESQCDEECPSPIIMEPAFIERKEMEP
jgi:hypothetical protein